MVACCTIQRLFSNSSIEKAFLAEFGSEKEIASVTPTRWSSSLDLFKSIKNNIGPHRVYASNRSICNSSNTLDGLDLDYVNQHIGLGVELLEKINTVICMFSDEDLSLSSVYSVALDLERFESKYGIRA